MHQMPNFFKNLSPIWFYSICISRLFCKNIEDFCFLLIWPPCYFIYIIFCRVSYFVLFKKIWRVCIYNLACMYNYFKKNSIEICNWFIL